MAIVANRRYYATAGVARLVSGLALLAVAWLLWQALASDRHRAPAWAGVLLLLSGIATAVSGGCMVALTLEILQTETGPNALLGPVDGAR